eukprot:1717066-Pyramimonas_sp.AAC.1
MVGGWFSKCGSRLSAAYIRFNILQELHGLRAVPFQNVVLVLAPRTLAFNICKGFTGSHDQRTRNCVWDGFRIMMVEQLHWFVVLEFQER